MTSGKAVSMRGFAFNIVGAFLMLAGVALIATTARGLSNYRAAVGRHGGEVIEVGADAQPQPGQHGFMARLAGVPAVVEAPHDPEFNQHVETPVLVRHVEMFQWREVRIGNEVHYELDWVDRPLDASHFREPAGHANPGSFPIGGRQFDSGLVQIGGFKVSPALFHAMTGSVQITPDAKSLPLNLAASFSQYNDYLTTSAHPEAPRLGDLRVSWTKVPLQQTTIVARIDGDRLVPAADAADGKGYDVEVGNVPLLDLFPDLPVPPDSVLSRQVFSVLLTALGVFLLLTVNGGRRSILLALAVGCMVVGAVASMMWLGNDTRMAFGWLGIAVLGVAVTFWRLRRPRTDSPTR
jgi:hypothetical protein